MWEEMLRNRMCCVDGVLHSQANSPPIRRCAYMSVLRVSISVVWKESIQMPHSLQAYHPHTHMFETIHMHYSYFPTPLTLFPFPPSVFSPPCVHTHTAFSPTHMHAGKTNFTRTIIVITSNRFLMGLHCYFLPATIT